MLYVWSASAAITPDVISQAVWSVSRAVMHEKPHRVTNCIAREASVFFGRRWKSLIWTGRRSSSAPPWLGDYCRLHDPGSKYRRMAEGECRVETFLQSGSTLTHKLTGFSLRPYNLLNPFPPPFCSYCTDTSNSELPSPPFHNIPQYPDSDRPAR